MTGIAASADLDLDAGAAEWDDLADRTGVSPFQRPGWIRAWWEAFRPDAREALRVLAVREPQGRLVGVLPLHRWRGVFHSPTNQHTPMFDPVVEPDAVGGLARAAFARSSRRISLAYLMADRPSGPEWEGAARDAGWRVLTRTFERSPYLDVAGDFASYEASLPSKLRSDLRRRRRRLEETGRVTIDVAGGGEDLDARLDEGFIVEASGWKGTSGTAIAVDPPARRFYTDVAHWAASRDWLRLWFLRVDGAPVAFALCLEHGRVIYLLKQGFDERWSRFAPGKLLVRATIEHAFDAGLARYEFLGHDEAFKAEWTATVRELFLLHAFAPNMIGRAEFAAYRYLRPLAVRTGLRQ